MRDTTETIKGFPLDKLGIEVDLNIWTDPAGQLLLEPIPSKIDEEKFGIERILFESELVFHDMFQETMNQYKKGSRK